MNSELPTTARRALGLLVLSVRPVRFFPLFLMTGVVGSAASALVGWTATERLSAGASGAICGVIGAAAVLGYRTQGARGPLTTSMARWLDIERTDLVDHRVVALRDDREPTVLEALNDVDLPQRTFAIEDARLHAAHEILELLHRAGLRQRRAA